MQADMPFRDATRFAALRLAAAGLVLLLPLPFAMAVDGPGRLQFTRDIRTGELQREELVAVVLDPHIYAHTRRRLADLRLLDAGGRETPFLLEPMTTTRPQTVRTTWTVRPESLQPLDDDGLEIELTLDPRDPQPSGLTVITPLRNFEQRLRVFGSADGEAWELLAPDALIFDYSRFMDIRRCEVRLPESEHRRFRIVIDAVTVEQESELLELTRRLREGEEVEREERVTRERRPFRIDRIEFWRETDEERVKGPATKDYPVAGLRTEHDPERKRTIVMVETQREPLTALELETPARNFTRRVGVERPERRGVRTQWRRIGEATLSRFAFRDLQRERLEVGFPETRSEQYRLVIDDRDAPPLEVTGIRATGKVYRLVYFADPAGEYRLGYGDPELAAPQYDTAALTAALGKGYEPVAGELGEVVERPVRRPLDLLALLNNPAVLFPGVAVLVGLLAWGLYAAARRVEALPGETAEPPGKE